MQRLSNIKLRKCTLCQKEYKPNSNGQKYCSKLCQKQAYSQSNNYVETIKKRNNSLKRKKWLKKYWKTETYKNTKSIWRKTPTGKALSLKRHLKRRARKMNIIETFTIKQFMLKVKSCNGICPYCKNLFDDNTHKITLDHFYPVKKANENYIKTGIKRIYTINDIGPMCLSCNSSKGDKLTWKNQKV